MTRCSNGASPHPDKARRWLRALAGKQFNVRLRRVFFWVPPDEAAPSGGRESGRPAPREDLPRRLGALILAATLVAGACSEDDDTTSTSGDKTTTPDAGATTSTAAPAPEGSEIAVFNGQGNDLVAYQGAPPFDSQKVFTNAKEDPEKGRDINAQICFFEDDGRTLFVAGEDTNQPDPPPGWGIFELEGTKVGDFEATQVGKLTPTYQPGDENPENYGCGVLSDGRIVTTDIGNQAGGAATGQLIIWFAPFDDYEVEYCKLDVEIGTAQQIHVDENDNVYLASALGRSAERPAGVYRFSPPFPTGDDEEHGCASTDVTGAPMSEVVEGEVFIAAGENGLATPNGIAPSPTGGFYVSSVITGIINEYDEDGVFVRTILSPPEGEVLADKPYSTGTPLGLGVAPDGTIYYADIGVVAVPEPGPGVLTGAVRRITFVDGEPQPPETMDTGLAFPDGIGIYVPSQTSAGGAESKT